MKRLDLTDRVSDELWMEFHDIVQETGTRRKGPKKSAVSGDPQTGVKVGGQNRESS